MSVDYDFDLFVIGAGSGGVRASRIAAQLGAKVAVAESRYLGGTCVNVGCVPKKLFVYASHVHEELEIAKGYGWDVKAANFNWQTLIKNKDTEIQRLNGIYQNLLEAAGVKILNGHAKIEGPHRVSVNGRTYSARHILIAAGGWPHVPEFPGHEFAITSNEVFSLESLPQSIVIYGGGYIAVEFAGIFNGLGVETHLVYRGPLFLRGFDQSIREHLQKEIPKKGVICHFETTINSVKNENDGNLVVELSNGKTINAGQVLAATGRKALTDGLGLENTGVQLNSNGQIIVDEHKQTAEPSVFAIGDVKGGIELTPVALAEGAVLANYLFAQGKPTTNYDDIPTAIFSQPSGGTVGLTEEQAKMEYNNIAVYESEFRHLKLTLTDVQERTYMKLIVDKDSDRVIGCHMVGQDAAEIIQGLAVAMKAGATKADFDSTIGIHPSAAEEFVTMRTPSR